jgi:ABC-type uncharacterized transport system auxiliary subunit
MQRFSQLILIVVLLIIILSSAACSFLSRSEVVPTSYYVLDYLPATENPDLIQPKPFPQTMEVMDTKLPRSYDRNQIVQKMSYTEISYFPNQLWANRLYDAVPNLLVRRLNAYNIFRRVGRDLMDTKPDYYLESTIYNIEYLGIDKPLAFLRMEFILRNANTQEVVFTDRHERTRTLRDTSVEYLVQCFNEMIMAETDLFAGQCIDLLSGKQVHDSFTSLQSDKVTSPGYQQVSINAGESVDLQNGQLYIPMMLNTQNPIPFVAAYNDTADIEEPLVNGVMNDVIILRQGKWNIVLGPQNISKNIEIASNMRTVIDPFWSELIIKVIDESQTKVRMQYDIYSKSSGQDAFDTKVDFRYSPSEEIGEYDYPWVLKPGSYMITLNGASPNELKDFTTVNLEEGKSYELTMVVNPDGERTVLVGAGILTSSESVNRIKFHTGAIHTNINLSSNNSVDKNNPTSSISLSSQFDNKVDYDIWPFHFTMKSLYDLGFDKTTGTEFRVNVDSYSLKNALVLYPWKTNVFLKNFGLYGRGDLNTHFFKEFAFFTSLKNFMQVSQTADTLLLMSAKKFQVKDSFYPMRLKEGTGLTYRLNLTPTVSVNLRSGYGWLQDYENDTYYYKGDVTLGSNLYEYFQENPSTITRGIETSVLLTANNILKIVSLTSTLDALFPMDKGNRSTRFDNENLVNIRLYRNISLDIKADIRYNKVLRDYVLTDYNAFLRLSLYY